MNKLTEAEFLDFYSKAYDETTDKLGQTISHTFSGEELFEFVNDAIEYKRKLKYAEPKSKFSALGDYFANKFKIERESKHEHKWRVLRHCMICSTCGDIIVEGQTL